MYINWDKTTSYDGILLPTYGNYGGFNYSSTHFRKSVIRASMPK
jgi:hypothetical protein